MIVGDEQPDRLASGAVHERTRLAAVGTQAETAVPPPGSDSTCRLPDRRAIRCRIATSPAEAVQPDVILMDLRMPGMDGVTAIAELARRGNPARVLVLTTYDTDSYVLPAIEAGATGYLLKDAPRDELLRAVRAAAAGQSVLSPSVATRLMSRVREPAPEVLSQRELEVLSLVAGGSGNRETAARLFISEATVKTHLLHIYAKLGVTDRAAAVAEAFNRGLLTPVKPERH
jgi:DNA-binding NarL/FixJ family response regulator